MKTATLGQVRKVLELLDGVPQEQMQAVLGSGLLSDLLSANVAEVRREEFRKLCGLVPVCQTFRVLVDRTKSLAEMIQVGKYDWVNSDIIQDHFPIQGSGQREAEVVLFHFNRTISSDSAIAEMDKAGFRPATIEELLALGANHKELQKQFPIVALGSAWQSPAGSRGVPFLNWGGVGRNLHLSWFGLDWRVSDRFAAVRK